MDVNIKSVDVIVVGAGLSGLVAADFIQSRDSNLNVIVLEAADRIGGRTCAQEAEVANSPAIEYDLGGEWILGSQVNLLQLIDRLGLQTYSPSEDSGANLKNLVQVGTKCLVRKTSPGGILPTKPGRHTGIRSWLAGLEMSYISWKIDQMVAALDLINPYNYFGTFGKLLKSPADFDSMTVDTYLKLNTTFKSVRDIIQIHFMAVMGVNLDRISLLYFLVCLKSEYPSHGKPFSACLGMDSTIEISQVRVKNGAFQISQRLVKRIGESQIFLNQPVQSIVFGQFPGEGQESNEGLVYVTTSTGQTFKSRRIILAVPPSSVRHFEFSPPLPPMKKFFIDRMSMGVVIKFYITYDEAYWTQKGFSGRFLSNGGCKKIFSKNGTILNGGPITWLADGTTTNQLPCLVGGIGGKLAVEWGQVSEDELRDAIVEQLCTIFGTWAQNFVGFTAKSWLDDPFAHGGTLNIPGLGTMFAYHALRQPFGPIRFAGTETAIHSIGNMSGAVESGEIAAIEVLDEIHPQCLSAEDYAMIKDSRNYGRKMNQSIEPSLVPFDVVKWTLVLPVVGIAIGCFAYKMCDRYGRLLIPF